MKNSELMANILVIGDRFTRKVWYIVLANKETPTVIQGLKNIMPQIATSGGSWVSDHQRGNQGISKPKQIRGLYGLLGYPRKK